MPQVVLDVESRELGIAAGLQDRVILWYATEAQAPASLVHMDLGTALLAGPDSHGAYTRLPVSELPPLYLAYDGRLAGDSGKVHSVVRARYERGDTVVLEGMAELAWLADAARGALARAPGAWRVHGAQLRRAPAHVRRRRRRRAQHRARRARGRTGSPPSSAGPAARSCRVRVPRRPRRPRRATEPAPSRPRRASRPRPSRPRPQPSRPRPRPEPPALAAEPPPARPSLAAPAARGHRARATPVPTFWPELALCGAPVEPTLCGTPVDAALCVIPTRRPVGFGASARRPRPRPAARADRRHPRSGSCRGRQSSRYHPPRGDARGVPHEGLPVFAHRPDRPELAGARAKLARVFDTPDPVRRGFPEGRGPGFVIARAHRHERTAHTGFVTNLRNCWLGYYKVSAGPAKLTPPLQKYAHAAWPEINAPLALKQVWTSPPRRRPRPRRRARRPWSRR